MATKDPVFTFEGSFPLDGEFEEVLKSARRAMYSSTGESSKLERASDVANKGKYSLLVSDRKPLQRPRLGGHRLR